MTHPAWRSRAIASVAIPAGLAVMTWAILLAVIGFALRFGPVTAYGFLHLAVIAAMLWPIVAFAPWRGQPDRRVRRWIGEHRQSLGLAAALAGLLGGLQRFDGPTALLTVLTLPTHLLDVGLFSIGAFYRDLGEPVVALTVVQFARWYLIGLWLYLVAASLLLLGRSVRRG